MKLTIREVLDKVNDIDYAAKALARVRENDNDPDLGTAEDFLYEYRRMILDTKIDI